MTIHDFDMARFLLGEVVEVHAVGANLVAPYIAAAGDIDSAVVVLRSADGALAHITKVFRYSKALHLELASPTFESRRALQRRWCLMRN